MTDEMLETYQQVIRSAYRAWNLNPDGSFPSEADRERDEGFGRPTPRLPAGARAAEHPPRSRPAPDVRFGRSRERSQPRGGGVMDGPSAEEMEAIARSYQELLVPAMFEDCAARILDVARPRSGDRVLDVACGTGVLARAAADRMGQGGSVVGLDMNPGMLSVAEELAPELDWRQGTAEDLPFDAGSFDLVACQLSLMFFEDRRAAIREMLRVLKPGGRLVVTVFGSLESIPAYERMIEVYDAVSDGQVGEFLRAPFALSDTDELRTLFAEGGLTSPHVSTQELDASFPNVRTFVLADVKGWFPLAGIELDEDQIEEVARRARSALEEYIGDEGRLMLAMPVHIVANIEDVA